MADVALPTIVEGNNGFGGAGAGMGGRANAGEV